MELNKNDLIKYWELKSHQKETSSNIGIIGDKKYFKKKMKVILKAIKHYDFMFANKELTKYTMINNGIETTYIQIEKLDDLGNTYFKKYM